MRKRGREGEREREGEGGRGREGVPRIGVASRLNLHSHGFAGAPRPVYGSLPSRDLN